MEPKHIVGLFSTQSRFLIHKIAFSLLIGFLFTTLLPAQIQVHGTFGGSTEFYQFNSADSTLRPRRPDFNYRLFFNPVIQFGKSFELPFSFEITKRFSEAYLPIPIYDNPIRSLANPNNNVGIHPTFKWMTFHLGSHTAQFSELSTGNLPIFGAGIDLKPGNFRLGYSYGISQWALQPDTTIHFEGNYERRFQAAKIGYGKEEGSGAYVNVVKIQDFNGGLDDNLLNIKAKEGVLATVDFRIKVLKHFTLSGEAGGSGFTNDLKSEVVSGDLAKIPDFLFIPRRTSKLDYAGKAAFGITYKTWGINFQAKYLGPGFESIGFAYVETDLLDFTVAPYFRLFKERLILNGSIGQRQDNLAKTKLTTTKKIIGSGNLTWMITKQISLSSNYSNYGTRNTIDNDTLRLEFVAQNFSISPSYRFSLGKIANTVSGSVASSQFDDKNLFTGELNSNAMLAISGNWTLVYENMNVTVLGSVSSNERSTGSIDIQTWSIQPGISLMKRKAQASCGVVYSVIEQTGSTADSRMMIKPTFRIKLTPKLQFKLNASWQVYQYGSARNDSRYNESFLQTDIIQTF